VRIVYPDGTVKLTPDLTTRHATAHASYINNCTGLSLSAAEHAALLSRMSLTATAGADGDTLAVAVPPTRPDVLHECDIMEDAAIAHGFNRLPDSFPRTNTVAQPLAISKLCDIIRREWAMCGWVEVLPLILVRTPAKCRPHVPSHVCAVLPRRELCVAEPCG
jgi:phenylalanyl-tRNA synthetase beta chain